MSDIKWDDVLESAANDDAVDAAETVEAEIIEDEANGGAAAQDAAAPAEQSAAEAEIDEIDAMPTSAADILAAAQAEAKDWQDKYLRLHAEWDTYRRRTNEQRAAEKVRATEKLVTDLLPVLDDFERTIKYGRENGEEGLLGGVEAVQSKLLDMLKRSGLEMIDRAGEPFDALQEQAVAVVPNPDAYEETVADVYQKGYRMGDKVLRAAMVTVTTGGPTRPTEEPEA
ncbi:MAG: nucleotide exchange factor GrpE [Eggerthellaceae bacterium]|nr:nucleotide exchange factor GrpE [Eggerthellaceae bacterium]